MAEFETTEKLVQEILTNQPPTRFSDHKLFLAVVRNTKPELLKKSFLDVYVNHKEYGLPKWETISRCRRKLQAKYPELKDPYIAEKRAERVKDFKDYARS